MLKQKLYKQHYKAWNRSSADLLQLFNSCNTIKGNESHVGNIQFWFFNINHLSIKNATFDLNPILIVMQTVKTRHMVKIQHFEFSVSFKIF